MKRLVTTARAGSLRVGPLQIRVLRIADATAFRQPGPCCLWARKRRGQAKARPNGARRLIAYRGFGDPRSGRLRSLAMAKIIHTEGFNRWLAEQRESSEAATAALKSYWQERAAEQARKERRERRRNTIGVVVAVLSLAVAVISGLAAVL